MANLRTKKGPGFLRGQCAEWFSYVLIRVHYLRRWMFAPVLRVCPKFCPICPTY